jgi:hypothetical protein
MTIQSDLGHIHGAAAAAKAALAHARVDQTIGSELGQLPGLDVIVRDLVTHATDVGEAVGLLASAVDLNSVTASAQAGQFSASPFDDAALKTAVSKLGTALAIGPLIDKFEKLVTDPANQAKLKKMAGDRGLTGGVDDARGALKSITPNTVAVSGTIRGLIGKLQSHQAVANSPATKASLAQIETDLNNLLNDFGNNVTRLVTVIDTGIGATFS